jgi:hypothetical protein
MTKNKLKFAAINVDEDVDTVQVNRINAKIHDLNIESMKEVERLQTLIKDYQKIVRIMYLSKPIQNWVTNSESFNNTASNIKIKTFFKAMEQGRMQ